MLQDETHKIIQKLRKQHTLSHFHKLRGSVKRAIIGNDPSRFFTILFLQNRSPTLQHYQSFDVQGRLRVSIVLYLSTAMVFLRCKPGDQGPAGVEVNIRLGCIKNQERYLRPAFQLLGTFQVYQFKERH